MMRWLLSACLLLVACDAEAQTRTLSSSKSLAAAIAAVGTPQAQRPPKRTDDSTHGFAVGDDWHYAGQWWQASDVTVGAAVWLPVTGSIPLPCDVVPIKLATSVISAGGSGYAVNNTVTDTAGNVFKVTGVSSGAVTTFTTTSTVPVATAPSSPVSQGSTSGAGTGATFTETYGGVVACYGQQKLRAAYTGNAETVSRASDGTTQVVGFLPSGALDAATMDAFTVPFGQTARVSTWNDQSGNAYDATQATASLRPQVAGQSMIGNSRSVNFDSTIHLETTLMQLNVPSGVALTTNQGITVCTYARNPTPEDSALWTLSPSGGGNALSAYTSINAGYALAHGFNSASLVFGISRPATIQPTLSCATNFNTVSSGLGTVTLYQNNRTLSSSTHAIQATAGGTIGSAAGKYGHIEIGAHLIFSRVLTVAEEQALQVSLDKAFGWTAPQAGYVNFVLDGDSISEGYLTANNATLARKIEPLLTFPSAVRAPAIVGETCLWRVNGGGPSSTDTFTNSVSKMVVPGAYNILYEAQGHNDFSGSAQTDLQMETCVQQLVALAKAQGFQKVILATVLPSYAWLPSNTTVIGYVNSYNTWLRANWQTIADGLSDEAADPTIGAIVSLPTTLYPDGTHASELTQAIRAPIAAAAINSVMAGVSY